MASWMKDGRWQITGKKDPGPGGPGPVTSSPPAAPRPQTDRPGTIPVFPGIEDPATAGAAVPAEDDPLLVEAHLLTSFSRAADTELRWPGLVAHIRNGLA